MARTNCYFHINAKCSIPKHYFDDFEMKLYIVDKTKSAHLAYIVYIKKGKKYIIFFCVGVDELAPPIREIYSAMY